MWAVGGVASIDPETREASDLAPLMMHWDGSVWGVISVPQADGFLADVSLASPDDAWAAGGEEGPVLLRWDGSSWALFPAALDDGVPAALSVRTARDGWLVGRFGDEASPRPLISHWNGRAWEGPEDVPLPGSLMDVAAISAGTAWAVGTLGAPGSASTGALTMHWDGTNWAPVENPATRVPGAALEGVSGTDSTDVWAVGSQPNRGGATDALAMHWNGTQWTEIPLPSFDVLGTALHGVDAVASNDVWAVGTFKRKEFVSEPLALHWDGRAWTAIASDRGGEATTLAGVLGFAGGDAWAVGYTQPDATEVKTVPFTEHRCG